MNDGRAIANFVLDECEKNGRSLTHLALQKIIFFCHAWSLAKRGEPLVKHQFEAWQFGPVLQYLYRDFKQFERDPITSRAAKLDPYTGKSKVVEYDFDIQTQAFLRDVIKFYSGLRPGTLVELSHVESGPWDTIWNHQQQVNPGMKISDELIAGYYRKVTPPF